MLVTRVVNNIDYEVDISTPGDLYFESEFAQMLPSDGLTDILVTLYSLNKRYFPGSLTLELSNECNFNCPFCYIHSYGIPKRRIGFDSLKSDLDYLISNGLLTCTLTGGEVLLHPDFEDIYKYLKQNGVLVTVLTNLSLLNRNHINLFKELPPYKVDVSIYGYSSDRMHEATGQKACNSELVLDNILLLKHENINVTCKTAENTLTSPELELIEAWCNDHKIPHYTSPEIFENYEGADMSKFSMDAQYIESTMLEIAKEKFGANYNMYNIKTNFDCKGGKYSLFVSHDYKLRPCLPFYKANVGIFDINSLGIKSALEKMVALINRYKNTQLDYCNGCRGVSICNLCVIDQLQEKDENEYTAFVNAHCKHLQSVVMNDNPDNIIPPQITEY